MLGDRERLAGERGLVDLQPLHIEQPRVGGHAVAVAHSEDVAAHDIGSGEDQRHPVAPNLGAHRRHARQSQQRALGAGLLAEAQQRVEHHDGQDHRRLGRLPDRDGDGARAEQQAHEGVSELAHRDPYIAGTPRRVDEVRPVARQAPSGLGCGQPASRVDAERQRGTARVDEGRVGEWVDVLGGLGAALVGRAHARAAGGSLRKLWLVTGVSAAP